MLNANKQIQLLNTIKFRNADELRNVYIRKYRDDTYENIDFDFYYRNLATEFHNDDMAAIINIDRPIRISQIWLSRIRDIFPEASETSLVNDDKFKNYLNAATLNAYGESEAFQFFINEYTNSNQQRNTTDNIIIEHAEQSELARNPNPIYPWDYAKYNISETDAVSPTPGQPKTTTFVHNSFHNPSASPVFTLADYSRYHSSEFRNGVVMFHGTDKNCEDGLCTLFNQQDWNSSVNILSTNRALGFGFYLTFSFDEALKYACVRLGERHATYAIVLEVIVLGASSIKHTTESPPGQNTMTFKSNRTMPNQIVLHPYSTGNVSIQKIHMFKRNEFMTISHLALRNSDGKSLCSFR